MKHIQGADPKSFSDMFGKDIILSFGDAAYSGRLRTLSTDFGGRARGPSGTDFSLNRSRVMSNSDFGRIRAVSGERYLMEKLSGVDPIDIDENKSDVMDMDFDMPSLVEGDGEDYHQSMKSNNFQRKRKAKRDRNVSLDILGLQYEPSAQKALLSSSPFGSSVGNMFAKSPRHQPGQNVLSRNLGDLMRRRTSTANSITTFVEEDIDVTMVETPTTGGFDNILDFGFSFEK